jgi:imidazole glycerol-phosphate synthase subunit HisH
MTVLLVNLGTGNLPSVRHSFEECGASVVVSEDPQASSSASRIVLPGVGAFGEAMQRLHATGWAEAIKAAADRRVPVLGICLGMQVLADEGHENGTLRGLGLIPGRIERMIPEKPGERIPHVGWNEVYPKADAALFRDISPGSDFYFSHSYHFVPGDPSTVLATTPYCGGIVSAVQQGAVMGVQFHPEKSSRAGFSLIRNFLAA